MNNLKGEWAPGVGIFETMRVEDGQIFAAGRHYERARTACEKLGFKIISEREVIDSSKNLIASEDLKVGRLRWQFSDQGDFSISYSEFLDPSNPANLTILESSKNYAMPYKAFPYKNLELLKRRLTDLKKDYHLKHRLQLFSKPCGEPYHVADYM